MHILVLLVSWSYAQAHAVQVSMEGKHRHIRSMNIVDEKRLGSLNTTQYLVQFCNAYCEGTKKKQFMPLHFLTTPRCLECNCDSQCRMYGDCCPSANGTIARDPKPPSCLLSDNDLDIKSKAGFGIFIVTSCDVVIQDDVFYPVVSVSKNMSYFNEEVAKCNHIRDYLPWIEDIDCSSGDYSGDNDATNFENSDPISDTEDDCRYVYSATRKTNPRPCDPIFTASTIIRTCNISGTWKEYDENIESACHTHLYHVVYGSHVYGNIFCAMCNGVKPDRIPWDTKTDTNLPPPITIITQFYKPHRPKKQTTKCKENEWLDFVKDSCLALFCVHGKVLIESEECAWSETDALGDEYTFSVLLLPEDSLTRHALSHWNSVQQMFLLNFQRFMTPLYTSNYMLSIGLIENRTILQDIYGVGNLPRAVLIACSFIITRSANRTFLETELYNFVSGQWVVRFDDNDHLFSTMFNVIPLSRVKLKAKYWSDPVSGRCCSPVADAFQLRNANGTRTSRVIHVTSELFCPHVKLPKHRYKMERNGWITLSEFNVSIPANDFSIDDRKRARICVDVLSDIHNGTYNSVKRTTYIPSFLLAQQILSTVCVTVSLICLALTLITYMVFPALRSLPAKNNMILITSLFLAQLLFQFGIDRTENSIVCEVIGVLIHFLWLCVAFWMNVCSFHMLRVFAVHNAAPYSRPKHSKSLFKYCIYAFGSSSFVVAVTITVNLVRSNGADIGYGGRACYLNSNELVGLAFVLPLCVILMTNLTFFIVTVRAISKIERMEKHGMTEHHNVYVYIKLSSLTGVFWIVAILSEVLQQEILVYVSIVVNGSMGVLIFVCYTTNRRVYDLWKGTVDKIKPKRAIEESRNITVSTSV